MKGRLLKLAATALTALTVAGLGLAAAPARAQLSTEYSIERFRMTGHRDGILDVEWGDVAGHLDVDVGLWVGYEDDPLNVYQAMGGGWVDLAAASAPQPQGRPSAVQSQAFNAGIGNLGSVK